MNSPVALLKTLTVDSLTVHIYESPEAVAIAGSAMATEILNKAIEERGQANAIFATGRSQIKFLTHLTHPNTALPWNRINGFHLDEYLGIAAEHPASFRHYLAKHLTNKVSLGQWHGIEGDADQPLDVCEAYAQLLHAYPADLCCLGVGNNGHLAFNDPDVADFSDPHTVKLVRLDEQNRQQQLDSSAFANLDAVPQYAFTLTLPAIQQTKSVLCLAYGKGKANIVHELICGPLSESCPASVLKKMPQATLLIDFDAACQIHA